MQNSQLPFALSSCNYDFPNVNNALDNPNGLLAVGGDLSVKRLVQAYRHGIFPWYTDGQPILWWSPDPRAILYLDRFKMSKSLSKVIHRNTFEIRVDFAFNDVVEACADIKRKNQDGTWITQEMQYAYTELFLAGYAHSVECWQKDRLVGGLYGLAMGPYFFGESMFSRESNASKVAFFHLTQLLKKHNFRFIDCQVPNPHLISLGVCEVDRATFINDLSSHVDDDVNQTFWSQSTGTL